MKLSEAAQLLHGRLLGQDAEFQGVSTDTRTLAPGELFVAIEGENFDGHTFVTTAEGKKAAGILAHHALQSQIPQIQVTNTIAALGQLAAHHRQQFNIPMIGVTGSCGKTTVKTMIANILHQCGKTLASPSSFNNNIGLPLTLLQLKDDHQYAVLEMGTNHFGEIAYLTQIAHPTVALITNAAPAHLEGLLTVEGVSRAKGEIFQGLASNGTAIINADDAYSHYWQTLVASGKILYFSMNKQADFMTKNVSSDKQGKTQFLLVTPAGEISIKLPLLGRHNVANAITAAAAAYSVGASLDAIKIGLETTPTVSKRLMEYPAYHGARLIDDSYNANPLSLKAALDVLAEQKAEKIFVMGDMKELGENAPSFHTEFGLEAKRLGINRLFTYGDLSQYTAQSFGENAQHFTDQTALIAALKTILNNQTTILIKGSRSMHMERIVEALVTQPIWRT